MGKDSTSCKEAIANWQNFEVERMTKQNEEAKAKDEDPPHPEPVTKPDPKTAEKVSLICQLPSIKKMDNKLNDLEACTHLSLSTNAIDRIAPLGGCKRLQILSLGRNNIKNVSKLDDVAGTLEQLWLSYNQIEKLDGFSHMKVLRVIYLSNNSIKSFDELSKLRELPKLEEMLLLGNPIYEEMPANEIRIEVIRRLPNLKKLDGKVVTEAERQDALKRAA